MWAVLLAVQACAQVPETGTEAGIARFVGAIPGKFIKVRPVAGAAQTGYTLVAVTDIAPRDPVATLPISFAVTSFDSFPLAAGFSDASDDFKVVARMLHERFYGVNNTFAKRWVDTFPGTGTNLFFWTEREQENLRKFDTFGLWNDQVDFRALFQTFQLRVNSTKGDFSAMNTYGGFLWGFAQFFRRCFSLQKSYWKKGRGYPVLAGDDDIEGIACYPLIDLAGYCTLDNPYYPQSITVVSENDTVEIVLKSEFYVNETERFCLSLGKYNSFETLMYQGMVFDYNPYNRFSLLLPSHPKLPCTEERTGSSCKFTLDPAQLSDRLLTYIRSMEAEKPLSAITNIEFVSHYQELGRGKANETQKTFVESLRKYRKSIRVSVLSAPAHSLRQSRRLLNQADTEVGRLTQRFAVSTLTGPYVHLLKSDRAFMQVLAASLSL